MSDDTTIGCMILAGIILVLIACATCGYIGSSRAEKKWQREAVARGVAGYDEQTGEWKWNVERKVAE